MAADRRAAAGGRFAPIAGADPDRLFGGARSDVVPYYRMYGRLYCLPAFIRYAAAEAAELAEAAETVDRIYRKALRFVQRSMPDAFLTERLGLPRAVIPAARLEVPHHLLSRQDWIVGGAGMHWIENNTDTPSGVPETAWLAGSLIAEHGSGYIDPSDGMDEAIRDGLRRLVDHYRSMGLGERIVFSAYDWHSEDDANTRYIMRLAASAGIAASYAPLESIRVVEGDGLYADGERIGIWYRLYPVEFLAEDRDEDGFPVGAEALRLAAAGRIGLINPAQSAITQSKGFMAMLWALAEQTPPEGGAVLTPDEAAFVKKYLPATHWSAEPFERTGAAYAAKGLWGREGRGTVIRGLDGPDDAGAPPDGSGDEANDYYDTQPKIYQQYVPMERVAYVRENERAEGWLLTGVYVIGGKYAGLLPRLGGVVTGDLACYAPAVVPDESESKEE